MSTPQADIAAIRAETHRLKYEKIVAAVRAARLEACRLHLPGFDGTIDRFIVDAAIDAIQQSGRQAVTAQSGRSVE